MKRPPRFLKQYFWDVDFAGFDYRRYPRYVVERLLEYGDEEALSWMMKNFSRDEIIASLKTSRQLTAKSANFWTSFFGLDEESVLCLKKSFRERRRQFWPY